MDAALQSAQSGSAVEINYSTINSASAGSTSAASRHSGGSSISGPIRHSDTQFDSSADETVIPYMIGERSSREFASNTSIERFDPEASPKSHLSHRLSRRSIDTEQCCGTLYEETLEAQLILPSEDQTPKLNGTNKVMSDVENNEQHADIEVEPHETQHLVSDKTVLRQQSQDKNTKSTARRRPLFSARLKGEYSCVTILLLLRGVITW